MADRTLPDPTRAFVQEMRGIKRSIQTMQVRQQWSGKTRQVEATDIAGTGLLVPGAYTNIAELSVSPGSWTVIARVILTVLNQTGNLHLTGKERANVRVACVDLTTGEVMEIIDEYWAQPASAVEPVGSSTALEFPMILFGTIELDQSCKFVLQAQCYDQDGVTPLNWAGKIMALPA